MTIYLSAGAIAAGTALVTLFIVLILRRRASVRLIMDNRLIDICPATVSAAGSGEPARQVIECVLSPFGLLVGGKVYKFGRDGIRLYAIDIGEDHLAVDFGSEKKRWTAALLHEPLGEEALARLAQRVEYETGINPGLSGSTSSR